MVSCRVQNPLDMISDPPCLSLDYHEALLLKSVGLAPTEAPGFTLITYVWEKPELWSGFFIRCCVVRRQEKVSSSRCRTINLSAMLSHEAELQLGPSTTLPDKKQRPASQESLLSSYLG